ncbi:hypothetical protein AXG93_4293s1020 [Marchantia polymorpha subsp. ruderalis]|uniref:Integrase catalytic domain-containing protein n=1 Tax=Marchantia polymorpha subsp. ruderalis TaxID=1480154 RepID=A0A176WJV6_MARPO|nr:hypothetical protein AXG93_4293s1020 [Marchantia polymorpha subsp. ruderalis]
MTPYNPKANGLREKSNELLRKILLKVTVNHAHDWGTNLPAALWAYQTTEKVAKTEGSRLCVFEQIYDAPPVGRWGMLTQECMTTWPNCPVNSVKWAPMWESGGYYVKTMEDVGYVVQEGYNYLTPIPPMHIPRYVPREVAMTVPQKWMVFSSTLAQAPARSCNNCGAPRYWVPNCPQPQRQMGYVPLCNNCRKLGHTAVEFETRSATRRKDAYSATSKQHKKQNSSTPKTNPSMPKGLRTNTSKPSAKLDQPSAKELRTSGKSDLPSDEVLVRILQQKYGPDIKDKVSDLLKDALRGKKPTGKNTPELAPVFNSSRPQNGQRKTTTLSPHYGIMADTYALRANITFQHLLEDNKINQKMLAMALRRSRRIQASKLLQVYQILHEDLGALEIDVEICGCTISKVPINSGSGVNIMTEKTTHGIKVQELRVHAEDHTPGR